MWIYWIKIRNAIATPKNSECKTYRVLRGIRQRRLRTVPVIMNNDDREPSSVVELLDVWAQSAVLVYEGDVALSLFESFDPARDCVWNHRCSMYPHSIRLRLVRRRRRRPVFQVHAFLANLTLRPAVGVQIYTLYIRSTFTLTTFETSDQSNGIYCDAVSWILPADKRNIIIITILKSRKGDGVISSQKKN